jgi:hypothetical protein
MKSWYRTSGTRFFTPTKLFRGGRYITSAPETAVVPLDLPMRQSLPMLSILQVTQRLSKPTIFPLPLRFGRSIALAEVQNDVTLRTIFVPPSVLDFRPASKVVDVLGSIPSNVSRQQSMLRCPLPFIANLRDQQLYATAETAPSSEKTSVTLHFLFPMDMITEANDFSYSKMNSIASGSSKESVTLGSQREKVLRSQEVSFDRNYFCMNRNARYPKRANHGRRPCSRQHRRSRRRRFGNHRR